MFVNLPFQRPLLDTDHTRGFAGDFVDRNAVKAAAKRAKGAGEKALPIEYTADLNNPRSDKLEFKLYSERKRRPRKNKTNTKPASPAFT
ncbi:hypothetical protein H9P43_002239 [Blastocladiella emersonii ATCC 22665]|nr:hypothetical protein H9P43_002239 [Blastocladiella emersonii ATCC 22665]